MLLHIQPTQVSPPDPSSTINHQPSTIHLPRTPGRKIKANSHRLHNIINAPINKTPTNLHSLPRPPPRPTPPNRDPRPLPRLLPPPLHPRPLLRNLLPSLLGRPAPLRNPLRAPPRPRAPRRLHRQSNRVRLPASRARLLLARRSTAAARSVREVCWAVGWGWGRCGLC